MSLAGTSVLTRLHVLERATGIEPAQSVWKCRVIYPGRSHPIPGHAVDLRNHVNLVPAGPGVWWSVPVHSPALPLQTPLKIVNLCGLRSIPSSSWHHKRMSS
jgi:hypothetical protein